MLTIDQIRTIGEKIPSPKKPDHRGYNKSFFTCTSQKPRVIIASICNDFILLLSRLDFCIPVIRGKLKLALCPSQGGVKGYMGDPTMGWACNCTCHAVPRREPEETPELIY